MTNDNLVQAALGRAEMNKAFSEAQGIVTKESIEYDCRLFFFTKDSKKKVKDDFELYDANLPMLGRYFVCVKLTERPKTNKATQQTSSLLGLPTMISVIRERPNVAFSVRRFWSKKKAILAYNSVKEMYGLK